MRLHPLSMRDLSSAVSSSLYLIDILSGCSGSYRSLYARGITAKLNIPDEGHSFKEIEEMLRYIIARTPDTSSPRFFSQLFGGRNQAALFGEVIAATLNTSMYTRKVGGIHIDIETALIGEMCRSIGYSSGDGTFNSGGSLSNMVAMVLARNKHTPEARETGCRGRNTIYTSADGHYSIVKNAGLLGIGRDMVRLIPVDQAGRMRIDLLEARICADMKHGLIPTMINATAGTTVRGSFDPLIEIAAVSQKHDIWMHVDGAFGASLLLCEETKPLLAGIDESDSVTWDAHKLMGIPLTCSVLLVKERGLLESNLYEPAGYLYQSVDEIEPGMKSLQCGRRNDALKLWCAWQFYGRKGFDKKFRHLRHLIHYARAIVKNNPDFTLVCEPASLTLCFTVKDHKSEDICAKLSEQHGVIIGYGAVNGINAIRLVCVNDEMGEKDISALFSCVRYCQSSVSVQDSH